MTPTKDVFTFCQNELPSASFLVFEDMRKKGELCDLTFELRDNTVAVHSVIVAAGIPYFRTLFTKSATEKEEIKATLGDLDPKAFESLIHFAYTSKVDISFDNAQSLIVASHFLQLDQVAGACEEFLSERLCFNNVGQVLRFASNVKNTNLIENCNRYIRNNFAEFSKCAEFLSLSFSCIREIISGSDFNEISEQIIFEAVMKWTKTLPSERQIVLPELLTEIRLANLPIKYLIEQVDSEEMIKNSKPCSDIISELKSYHLLHKTSTPISNLKTQPQNLIRPNILYAVCQSDSICSIQCFDSSSEKWNNLAVGTEGYDVHGAVFSNGKIYILRDDSIQAFCPKTNILRVLESNRTYTTGSVIASCGNIIYCIGSFESCFRNSMRRFDTEQNKWVKTVAMRNSRLFSGACALLESIYVTGGYYCAASVEKYDPRTHVFSDVTAMLTPRAEHGCTSVNERMYVFGGENIHHVAGSGEVYDPHIDQWSTITPLTDISYWWRYVSHNGKIYAFYEGHGVAIYNPDTDEWNSDFTVPDRDVRAAVSIAAT